jgi:phosphoribosylanthranilate isomerase
MTDDQRPRIKICGLCREEDIQAVNDYMPDYGGFVFAQGSRRQVSMNQAAAFRREMNAAIKAVGVFVDAPIALPVSCVTKGIIDLIQLHGAEDSGYIRQLRRRLADSGRNVPIIKAFSIANAGDVSRAVNCEADYILLDHGAGGTGRSFDWDLIRGVRRPYFLAGGLNDANVETAIIKCRPFAVDISSGVESSGLKDPEKIEQIIRRIRNV